MTDGPTDRPTSFFEKLEKYDRHTDRQTDRQDLRIESPRRRLKIFLNLGRFRDL